jgi:hypothetical protein
MQTEAIPITELDRAEARLPRWMLALACAGTTGCLLAGHARLGASFALGSSVAILNYYWLHQLVKVLMAAVEPRLSIMAVVKLLLRYPLLVCGAYILYRTGWLPLAPFFVGLFVPVAGAILESVLQIRACWRAT